ncbi:tryptophan-associated transmembrane protein [Sediminihabitans luteus]|uniref:Tryptophan-associated transmembrane protein n=1 Tax=Sediminihabitans luteus TaxID=1138585 RepID=A0A2M9CR34_9CELL|nr:Trp biosynthesis-associated membrane protein [Sediminihabitans luteus]PJJ74347.1 tryptophan-associated transmembrane protein [Sediminihabitans luteus]GIJ00459.1 hypothetical protein Slu03_28360 [Sediminihabitans luteus]
MSDDPWHGEPAGTPDVTPADAPGAPRVRRPTRRDALLSLLLLGGIALLLAVPTWLTSSGATAIDPEVDVVVTGTAAAPGVGAGALVLVASALALGLVGRVARWVVLAVAAVSGVVIGVSAAVVALDPVPTATSAAADATGVTDLTGPVDVAPWPWGVVVVAVLVLLVVVAAARTSGSWSRGSARHERGAQTVAAPADDPAALWDALTHEGDDDPAPDGPEGPARS